MGHTIESKRRSRVVRIGSTAGVVVAAGLVFWGFSRADDDRSPSDTPPTIGIIGGPADVLSTQPSGAHPSATSPITADLPVVTPGTADIALPPISSDINTP